MHPKWCPLATACSAFQALREGIQLQFPALTPVYLRGSNLIIALSCAAPDAECA